MGQQLGPRIANGSTIGPLNEKPYDGPILCGLNGFSNGVDGFSSNGGGSIESTGSKSCNLDQGKPWPIFFGWAQSFGAIFVPCRSPGRMRKSFGWAPI